MGHFIIKIIDVITGTITVIVGICIIGMITVGILFLFMPTTISSGEAKELLEERLDVELAGIAAPCFGGGLPGKPPRRGWAGAIVDSAGAKIVE